MELRYNPLLGEWILVSDLRQHRPLLPESRCPFCPGSAEIPSSDWDTLHLPNRYPLLIQDPPAPIRSDFYSTRPAKGVCEVIVYSPDHQAHFPQLSITQISKIVQLWQSRTRELSSLRFIKYIYIFENRGRQIGVTLDHPHCQLHGYPFIPPRISQEIRCFRRYLRVRSRCLICDLIQHEQDSPRLLYSNSELSWIFPFFPRWPYETHIYPKSHIQWLTQLEPQPLAKLLKLVVSCYDQLFGFQMPYMMAIHQAPSNGRDRSHFHLHIEFYPVYREKDKLKFFAGAEMGAGVITYDYTPEQKAQELKQVLSKLKF